MGIFNRVKVGFNEYKLAAGLLAADNKYRVRGKMSKESSVVKILIAAVAALITLLAVLVGIVLTPDTNSVDIKVNTTRIEQHQKDIESIELTLRLLRYTPGGPSGWKE